MGKYQTGRNYEIAYGVEAIYNEAPLATAGKVFRPTGGSLQLNKSVFASNEIRRDGLQIMGRHGSRSVAGTLNGELSIGTFDDFFEAALRDTWTTMAPLDQTVFTSYTTPTAHTIVAAAGDFTATPLKLGSIIKLSAGDPGNINRGLRVTAIAPLTLTVAETLVVSAVPVSSFTITGGKKLMRVANTPYIDRTFTIEEHGIDVDTSELYTGCAINSGRFQLQPNGMVLVSFGIVGTDADVLEGATSPYFIDPAITTTLPLVATDARLTIGDEEVTDLTAFDLTFTVNAGGVPVVGSYITPAIFTNMFAVTGSISALRKDLSKLHDFIDEVEFSISCTMVESGANPDFFSITLPSVKFADINKNELGSNGPRIETLPILVGYDPQRDPGFDPTSLVLQTSAA